MEARTYPGQRFYDCSLSSPSRCWASLMEVCRGMLSQERISSLGGRGAGCSRAAIRMRLVGGHGVFPRGTNHELFCRKLNSQKYREHPQLHVRLHTFRLRGPHLAIMVSRSPRLTLNQQLDKEVRRIRHAVQPEIGY